MDKEKVHIFITLLTLCTLLNKTFALITKDTCNPSLGFCQNKVFFIAI